MKRIYLLTSAKGKVVLRYLNRREKIHERKDKVHFFTSCGLVCNCCCIALLLHLEMMVVFRMFESVPRMSFPAFEMHCVYGVGSFLLIKYLQTLR